MMQIAYFQDGSAFYLASTAEHVCTAPRRVWDKFPHDTMDAAELCRAWFVEWSRERGISPDFT